MPITDAVKNRYILVPVKVVNKASEAVNVKIAAGSIAATISSKDLIKLQKAVSGSQKIYYTKKVKQERTFLKYLGVTILGAVATGVGVYVGRHLYKKMFAKTIGKVKEDVFGTTKVAMYNVFGKAFEFIKNKFSSLIELVKNDFHEILGDKLGAVWDAAKGVFGWFKKTVGWFLKFFLIRFAARHVLTKYGGFTKEQAVTITSPLKFFMSKFFRFPLYFKLFSKFLTYIKDVVMVSGFLSRNFKSKVLDKIELFKEKFLGIVNSERFKKVKELFETLGKSKLVQTISEYASKLGGSLKKLWEMFNKGNTSLKDKIFGFVKSIKDSIMAKYASIKQEAMLDYQLKKIRKREVKDAVVLAAKKERNEKTKAKLRAKFKRGIFGNQVGSIGAQPIETGEGIGAGDIWSLVSSYLGLNFLTKGKLGELAKGGLNLGKKLLTTKGGSALLSGGLATLQGGGIGTAAGVIGGSFAGQHIGGMIGGAIGMLGGPAGVAAGIFAGELIGGFVGGWIGKNVGGMIENEIKTGFINVDPNSTLGKFNKMLDEKEDVDPSKDFAKLSKNIKSYFSEYLGVGSFIGGLWDGISSWIYGIWDKIVNFGKNTVNAAGGVLSRGKDAVKDFLGMGNGDVVNGVNLHNYNTADNAGHVAFIRDFVSKNPESNFNTPEQVEAYIRKSKPGSPLIGSGKEIFDYAKEKGVPLNVLLGTLQKESQLGSDPNGNITIANKNPGNVQPMSGSGWKLGQGGFASFPDWLSGTKGTIDVLAKRKQSSNLGSDPLAAMFNGIQYAAKNFSYEYGGGHGVDPNITKRIDCTGLVNYGYRTLLDSIAGQISPEQMAKYKDLTTGGSADLLRKNAGTLLQSGKYGAVDIKPGDAIVGLGHGAIAYQDPITGKTLIAETSRNPDVPGGTVKTGIFPEEYIRKAQQNNMAKISPLAGLTTISQIADLEKQKNTNNAQTTQAQVAAAQAAAAAATNLPKEMDKNTNNIMNNVTQMPGFGGKQQNQMIYPFDESDLYLHFLGMYGSIFNP